MISNVLKDPKQLLKALGASPCKINDLVLDVVVSEGVEISWTANQYKLQSGFSSSSARIKDRVRLNLDCVFVDKSYGVIDLISAGLNGTGFAPETWRDKYDALKMLADTEDIVTVVIGLDTFPNMAIKNIGIVRDEKRAGYLSFSLSIEEMPVVDIDFEMVDNSLMPKDGQSDKEKNKANDKKKKKASTKKQEPKKTDEPRRQSTLHAMRDAGKKAP
jgi:hypothetical protein